MAKIISIGRHKQLPLSALRLYEQEPGERWGSPRLESYVTRWRRWATAGVSCVATENAPDGHIETCNVVAR